MRKDVPLEEVDVVFRVEHHQVLGTRRHRSMHLHMLVQPIRKHKLMCQSQPVRLHRMTLPIMVIADGFVEEVGDLGAAVSRGIVPVQREGHLSSPCGNSAVQLSSVADIYVDVICM